MKTATAQHIALEAAAPKMFTFLQFLLYDSDSHLPSTCVDAQDTANCLRCRALDILAPIMALQVTEEPKTSQASHHPFTQRKT